MSGLCKSRKEFDWTDQALRSLDVILNQIGKLANQVPQQTLPGPPAASSTTSASGTGDEVFKELEQAVQRCVNGLEPLKSKAENWKKAGQNKSLQSKATQAVHMYFKSRDLEEIHSLVQRHVGVHISFDKYRGRCEKSSEPVF